MVFGQHTGVCATAHTDQRAQSRPVPGHGNLVQLENIRQCFPVSVGQSDEPCGQVQDLVKSTVLSFSLSFFLCFSYSFGFCSCSFHVLFCIRSATCKRDNACTVQSDSIHLTRYLFLLGTFTSDQGSFSSDVLSFTSFFFSDFVSNRPFFFFFLNC